MNAYEPLRCHSLCTPVFTGCRAVDTIKGASCGCDLAAVKLEELWNTM